MVFAQDNKRGSEANSTKTAKGVKRALVVGIAGYQAASLKLNYSDGDTFILKTIYHRLKKTKEYLVSLTKFKL